MHIFIYHNRVVPGYKHRITKHILTYMIVYLATELFPTASTQSALQDQLPKSYDWLYKGELTSRIETTRLCSVVCFGLDIDVGVCDTS